MSYPWWAHVIVIAGIFALGSVCRDHVRDGEFFGAFLSLVGAVCLIIAWPMMIFS